MESVWNKDVKRVEFEPLSGNIKTDVLIIGGGLAGILCAHMLRRAGVDCVLAEAKRICEGVTCNTTAKITFLHGAIFDKLIKRFGERNARLYCEAQSEALKEYEKLCSGIDCDYEKRDSFVYSLTDREKIEKEIEALKRLGVDADFSYARELPFEVAGAVCVSGQAQFHPLKFALSLARDLPIYENTKITELKPGKAVTERGEIAYKKAIVATHFPTLNKHGGYFLKMYQHRSYVLALEGAQNVDGMYVDENEKGLSFREHSSLLLLGGGSHRTGKKGGSYNELEEFARTYYPSSKIVAKWATQDCMTLDSIPYIGSYSKGTPNLYTATGFNKWGMSSSMLSAMILTDLVQGKRNKYASLFSPSRSILRPQLALNTFESVVGLLTPTAPRCPHLGCALKYNSAEHTWDCPCHGSRFDEKGEVINNPATDDKKKPMKKR